jgi:FAD/FMN-containing dehydrogenase
LQLFQLVRGSCDADLTAFELISTRALRLLPEQIKSLGEITNTPSGWVVLFELSSMEGQEKSYAQLESVLEIALNKGLISDAVIANSLQQSNELWGIRESIPEAQLKLGTIIKHDISLPISALTSFIHETKIQLKQLWGYMEPIVFGHVGDGNLHYNLAPINQGYSLDIESKRKDINKLVHDQVYKYSGSFSAEHGIGQSKVEELPLRKSSIEMELMHSIKRALDPSGIMNPGKILKTNLPAE